MSGTSNLLQLWQIPATKLLPRSYKLSKDMFLLLGKANCAFCRKLQTSTYDIVKGSYLPLPRTKQEINEKENGIGDLETVRAFQKLPMVPSVDILYSALRKAKRVSPTKGIANIAKRERNRSAKQLDALMKELALPLRNYKEHFSNKRHLHPYERSLIELTLGDGNYEQESIMLLMLDIQTCRGFLAPYRGVRYEEEDLIIEEEHIDDEPDPDGVIQEQGIRRMDAFRQSIAEAIWHAYNSECP